MKMSVCLASCLEKEPYADLAQPGTIELACYSTECGAAEGRIRRSEPWCIGEIEKFGTELQFHVFPEGKILEDGRVEVMDAVRAQAPVIPRSVAWNLGRRGANSASS